MWLRRSSHVVLAYQVGCRTGNTTHASQYAFVGTGLGGLLVPQILCAYQEVLWVIQTSLITQAGNLSKQAVSQEIVASCFQTGCKPR